MIELLAVMVIIASLTILITPFYKSYKLKKEYIKIFKTTQSIVKSIVTNDQNSCYYEFDYITNTDADFKDLIIIRYKDNNEKEKFAVYLKKKNTVIIDAADFSSLNSKKVNWIKKNNKSATYIIDKFSELEDSNTCQNVF